MRGMTRVELAIVRALLRVRICRGELVGEDDRNRN